MPKRKRDQTTDDPPLRGRVRVELEQGGWSAIWDEYTHLLPDSDVKFVVKLLEDARDAAIEDMDEQRRARVRAAAAE